MAVGERVSAHSVIPAQSIPDSHENLCSEWIFFTLQMSERILSLIVTPTGFQSIHKYYSEVKAMAKSGVILLEYDPRLISMVVSGLLRVVRHQRARRESAESLFCSFFRHSLFQHSHKALPHVTPNPCV